MRNYLDTLLNLHPTAQEQDARWETPDDEFKNFIGLLAFLALLVVLAVIS